VGKAVTLSFATPRAPDNSFENLASYSSQGAAAGLGWRFAVAVARFCAAGTFAFLNAPVLERPVLLSLR
jgi:hypothetical protein